MKAEASGSVNCSDQSHNVMWLTSFDAAEHATGGIVSLTVSFSGPFESDSFAGVVMEDVVVNNSYMPSTDLPGADYSYFAVNYSDQCAKACNADNKCKAWSYVGAPDQSASSYPVPRCCLKNTVPRPMPATASITSGVKAGFTALTLSVLPDAISAAAEVVRGTEGSSAPLQILDRAAAFKCGANVTCGVATVTHMDPAHQHTVRVLFRRGMWEVYADELLAQTYTYGGAMAYPLPQTGTGRVGLMCSGFSTLHVDRVGIWQMSL